MQGKDNSFHVLGLKPNQAACRVLIADDIEDNRQLLAELSSAPSASRHSWPQTERKRWSSLSIGGLM